MPQPPLSNRVSVRIDPESVGPVGELVDSATGVVIQYPLGEGLAQSLDRIDGFVDVMREQEWLLVGAVAAARASGATWAVIARALGVSRQAARQRYGPLLGESDGR